jgi:hypothetical protein
MELKEIKQTLNSGSGLALKEYLSAKLNELKSIDNISEKDVATHQVVEIKAQKRAYKKLKEIMQDIMTFSEETKPKDPRDSYGITDEDL